jgi:hypothetical protein
LNPVINLSVNLSYLGKEHHQQGRLASAVWGLLWWVQIVAACGKWLHHLSYSSRLGGRENVGRECQLNCAFGEFMGPLSLKIETENEVAESIVPSPYQPAAGALAKPT